MDIQFESLLSYSEQNGGTLTVERILLCLCATFAISQVVGWVYLWAHRGVSYAASLAQSLVVLSLIIALVMLVVGNNLARAFGLFGALALIRFRTPVKDTKDTVFLFLSVGMGIATGTGHLLAAALGGLFICLVLLYLAASRFGSRLNHDGLLRLSLPGGKEEEQTLYRLLARYCDSVRLIHLREAGSGMPMEYSFQIQLLDSRYGSRLLAEVGSIPGVVEMSLLLQDDESQP